MYKAAWVVTTKGPNAELYSLCPALKKESHTCHTSAGHPQLCRVFFQKYFLTDLSHRVVCIEPSQAFSTSKPQACRGATSSRLKHQKHGSWTASSTNAQTRIVRYKTTVLMWFCVVSRACNCASQVCQIDFSSSFLPHISVRSSRNSKQSEFLRRKHVVHMKMITIPTALLISGFVYLMFLFMEDAVAVAGKHGPT